MTMASELPYSGHMTISSPLDSTDTKFHGLLNDQVRSELGASQQYLAIAVYFDGADLPQLASFFYRQSVEERNHAMMIVQYFLDRDMEVEIPGIPAKNGVVVAVTLIDKRSGKPVPDAVIFAQRIDMAPDGMEMMASPIETMPCMSSARNSTQCR